MQPVRPGSHEHGPRSQTRSAITLTVAGIFLFSGLWALWYTPTLSYESRKNEQLAAMTIALEPNSSSSNDLNLNDNTDEITVALWGQHPGSVFSARVLDSEGNVLKSYDNITAAGEGNRITIAGGRDAKLELYNNTPEEITIEVQVTDVSKVPNHPNEGFGQWLTVVSLPIFGLALWFVFAGRKKSGQV